MTTKLRNWYMKINFLNDSKMCHLKMLNLPEDLGLHQFDWIAIDLNLPSPMLAISDGDGGLLH